MKLPRSSLVWCVLIVCLTLLIFTYLTRKSLVSGSPEPY
ncbi:Hok/Gef family protein [Escherichia coli]|nr:Hok/Gef family protein [Escherichia coli]